MKLIWLTLLVCAVSRGEAYRAPAGINLPTINIQAPISQTPSNWDVDPDFVPYVLAFKRDYFKYLHKTISLGPIKVVWEDQLNNEHAGLCHYGRAMWIGVNRLTSGWPHYTDCQKEELIYHELGHCVLNEPHTEFGIMHYQIRPAAVCENTREASKRFLFESARPSPQRNLEIIYSVEENTDE